MSNRYGAVDDDINIPEYYQQPEARERGQKSYSSNAASIDEYMEIDGIMDGKNEFMMTEELERRIYDNEFDLDVAKEPRDIYKANHFEEGSKPSRNLKCIWFSLVFLFICICAAAICIDRYVINIYGNSSEFGLYFWNFGWNKASFHPQNTPLSDTQIPLTFTRRYAVDAGRFLIIAALIIIICLSFIMIILCARCNNEVYLYILCCSLRIPQAPSLYILFSTIKHYSRIAVYLYLFVMLYGMLEMNFYAHFVCQGLGGSCYIFAIPHFGLLSLFFIGLIINCFVMKRVVTLDHGFNKKTIQYYYPDHVRRINCSQCRNIHLDYLKTSIHTIRIIIICTSVIFITFNNVGLILIGDWNKSTHSFSLFFQFQGLVNDKGLKYENISQADNFVMLCWFFKNILLPFILIANTLFLFYFYYVIIKFHSIPFSKFIIIILMFIAWISFTIISVAYYYTFYLFWKNWLKDNREQTIYHNAQNVYQLFWSPDWGILLILIIDWYLFKLIVFAYKSM